MFSNDFAKNTLFCVLFIYKIDTELESGFFKVIYFFTPVYLLAGVLILVQELYKISHWINLSVFLSATCDISDISSTNLQIALTYP